MFKHSSETSENARIPATRVRRPNRAKCQSPRKCSSCQENCSVWQIGRRLGLNRDLKSPFTHLPWKCKRN